jgi:small subunit ribosomal protein S6
MAGQPKAPFWLAVWAVILGLVGLAAWRAGMFGPRGAADVAPPAPVAGGAPGGASGGGGGAEGIASEAADTSAPTTVTEYTFTPAEKLPPVKGTSAYKALEDETVRFALNVWAGWSPIIYANEGFKAGKVWQTPDGRPFKLELVLIDNPVTMRDAYAAGEVHIGWATLDMLPLFIDSFAKDSRIMPRVYQQVDFSNGGDGIVVREGVRTVRDLAGKKLVLAQNSPSQFFALNMLVAGGLQPGDVDMVYTEDAFQAAAAFNAQKDLAGCVSWAPDIYNLEKSKGNRMLVTTQTANRLIADIWFARADFATDHPDKIEGLVRGIFDAMTELKTEGAQAKVAALMAEMGGEVKKREYWGLRSLAYRIKKNRKGHYVHLAIDGPWAPVGEVERQLKINEDVIRYMTIRVEALEEGPSAVMQAKQAKERRDAKWGRREDEPGFEPAEEGAAV